MNDLFYLQLDFGMDDSDIKNKDEPKRSSSFPDLVEYKRILSNEAHISDHRKNPLAKLVRKIMVWRKL